MSKLNKNQEKQTADGKIWEIFCDESYYHLWCVRRKQDREFGYGFHLNAQDEAKGLVELLNKFNVDYT